MLRLLFHVLHTVGTKTLSTTSEDDNTASVISKDGLSTSEVMATAVEGYTSNEDSMSHTAGNDTDKDDEQSFDEDKEQLTKSLSPRTNSLTSPNDWSKSEWPSIEPQASWENITDTVLTTSTSKLTSGSTNGASAFNGNRSSSLLKSTSSLRSSKNSLSAAESDNSLKGRLNQSDIERLEEQAKWASREIDYFADMQPVIVSSKPSTTASVSTSAGNNDMTVTNRSTPSVSSTTNKLNYVLDDEVGTI